MKKEGENESIAEIDSVGAETFRVLFHSKEFLAFSVIALFSLFATQYTDIGWPIFFIFTLGGFIRLITIKNEVQSKFMSRFSEMNGYLFSEEAGSGEVEKLHGSIFKIGINREMKNIIRGEYLNSPISIFNYTYETQDSGGKNRHTSSNTVFELTFNTNLPNIFLVGKWFFRKFLIRSSDENLEFASNPEKVPLTGGLDSSFTLYAPKDYEIEALQIFDTDVLEMLSGFRKKVGNFAIELTEDKLYIYINGSVENMDNLKGLYEMAKLLVEKLRHELKIMKPGLDAQEETFRRLSRAAEKRI